MGSTVKKIALLSGGGDCPGLNAVIRTITKTAISKYGYEVIGFVYGYRGLYHNNYVELTEESVEDIYKEGGTILYSSNKDNLFDYLVDDGHGGKVKKDVSDVAVENLKKALSSHTKIVSLAQITNVLGFEFDVKSFAKIIHENGSLFILDGAQSVPHMKIDVKDLDVDFLAFSGHKMCGPTGIGVLYGKYELLDKLDPVLTGGGMNTKFDTCGNIGYLEPPLKFEAGTQNIAGVIGLGAAIDYLNKIGMDNIHDYEKKLHDYAIKKLKELRYGFLLHASQLREAGGLM